MQITPFDALEYQRMLTEQRADRLDTFLSPVSPEEST